MGKYRCESIGVFYVQRPYGFDDDYDFEPLLFSINPQKSLILAKDSSMIILY